MANDAISRSALLKQMDKYIEMVYLHDQMHHAMCAVAEYIKESPAIDAVPVVRCKDCWKRGGYQCPMFYEELESYDEGAYEWIAHDSTEKNGFCDRGERMDGEDNEE